MTDKETQIETVGDQARAAAKAIAPVAARPEPVRTDDFLAALGATIVKQVTRTVLQQNDGIVLAVEFESAAIESEIAEQARGKGTKMAPARTCDVINLRTGEKQLLIMNTVLEGELDKHYPKQGYVGKQFAFRSYFPQDGVKEDGSPKYRNYKLYNIVEIQMKANGAPEGVEVVADGSDPVNRKGGKPKG